MTVGNTHTHATSSDATRDRCEMRIFSVVFSLTWSLGLRFAVDYLPGPGIGTDAPPRLASDGGSAGGALAAEAGLVALRGLDVIGPWRYRSSSTPSGPSVVR